MEQYIDLTKQIIGCAYKVYNTMGFGYLESVYEKSMLIELQKVGIVAQSQVPIDVFYENQNVGKFVADILVEDKVIVELKSVKTIIRAHEVQLVNYLTATQKDIGLIINFAESEVEVKRKVRLLSK
jgi:GxxExxY protein